MARDAVKRRNWDREYYQKTRTFKLAKCRIQRLHDIEKRSDHGLNSAQVETLLALQDGGCAVCRSTRLLRADRNGNGVVLGILCRRCKKVVDYLRKDKSFAKLALKYIESSGTKPVEWAT
jgi:hypothetical protein